MYHDHYERRDGSPRYINPPLRKRVCGEIDNGGDEETHDEGVEVSQLIQELLKYIFNLTLRYLVK